MLIRGQRIDSGSKIEVFSPYSGRVVGAVPALGARDVKRAIAVAKEYDHSLSGYRRYEILLEAAKEIGRQKTQYAELITSEIGISLKDSMHEVDRGIHVLTLSAEEAKRIGGEVFPTEVSPNLPDHLAIVIREPVGVVGCITPFNHPLNQVVHKVGPALAANNAVVLKPSVRCPLTALKFASLLLECGLPPEMLQVITGRDEEIGLALIEDPGVDMISFTGSTQVGAYITRHAGIKRLSVELGGNDVFVVAPDADKERAVGIAVGGAFGNSGQRCSSIKRIVAFPDNAEPFAQALAERAQKIVVGDPMDPSTDMGTVVNEEAARRIERRIQDAVANGASLLAGGKREGALLWPTVLDRVDVASELVREETFGPVAPIIRARDFDQAVAIANDTPFGLNAAIMTNDLGLALAFSKRLKVGGIRINQAPSFRNEFVPFGGNKLSGFGRSGVKRSVEEMTNLKTVIIG